MDTTGRHQEHMENERMRWDCEICMESWADAKADQYESMIECR